MAGLKVQKILDEPTAAAIAFGADNVGPNDAANVLVYDLGGGTFDISVLTVVGGVFAQLDIEGDMWLGGDDFDHKIMDHVLNHVNNVHELDASKNKRFLIELKKRSEQAKKALSSMTRTDINVIGLLQGADGTLIDVELELTRDEFEAMIRPEVERSVELVKSAIGNANLTVDEIDHVLLVGGSSCIPMVRKALVGVFGQQKVRMDVDPMKCVAFGAAILAARLGAQVECAKGHINPGSAAVCGECGDPLIQKESDIEIGSVTAQDYGIEVTDGTSRDKFEPIIRKGSSYPSPEPVVQTFKVPSTGLRRMRIRVFAGSNPVASKNELQVTVWLELPPNVLEGTPLDVALKLDRDCIIERVKVSLKDGSGREIEVFPDRGGDVRSRLEKRLEEIRRGWDKVRSKAGIATVRAVESLYDEVIRAANAGKLAVADKKLQEMKKEVDDIESGEIRRKSIGIINYSEMALGPFGFFVDAAQTARIRRMIEELQAAIDAGDKAEMTKKYAALDKETDELPNAVVQMLRIDRAIYLAQEAGNLSAADRMRVCLSEIVSAARRRDYNVIGEKIREIAPLASQFNEIPISGQSEQPPEK
jgi:molecular chaperone DnaK (HSP70)